MQLAAAERELCRKPVPPGNSIHAARKSLKRARATLRVLRPAVGDRKYHLANETLRDAAAPLSPVRDAIILLESFDLLRRRLPPSLLSSVSALRRVLEHERRMSRQGLLRGKMGLKGSIRTVAGVARSIEQWPKERWQMHSPRSAAKHAYRKVRAAFIVARRRPSDGNLHEWRKQAKYFLHEMQVLFTDKPKYIAKLIRRTRRLSNRLGDDHDLALLRHKALQNAVALGEGAVVRAFTEGIDRRRAALQTSSWRIGKRFCAPSPQQMIQRFPQGRVSRRAVGAAGG